jgi:hypothetical protein
MNKNVIKPATRVASIPFLDGISRPVYLDADGRQYVLDDDGQPGYGVWVHVDEPVICSPDGPES